MSKTQTKKQTDLKLTHQNNPKNLLYVPNDFNFAKTWILWTICDQTYQNNNASSYKQQTYKNFKNK